MPTPKTERPRSEVIAEANNLCDTALVHFQDTVLGSSASDTEKANILHAFRLYTQATRQFVHAAFLNRRLNDGN